MSAVPQEAVMNTLYGAAGVIGTALVCFYVLFTQLRRRAFDLITDFFYSKSGKEVLVACFREYLNSKDSELSVHEEDESAHEHMRKNFAGSFNESFELLQKMISEGQVAQTVELNNFRQQAMEPLIKMNNRLMDILQIQGKETK